MDTYLGILKAKYKLYIAPKHWYIHGFRKCSALIENVRHVSFLHKAFQGSSANDGNFQVFKHSEVKRYHDKIVMTYNSSLNKNIMLQRRNFNILHMFIRKCSALIENVGHVSFLRKAFQSSSANDGNFQVFKNSEVKRYHNKKMSRAMHPTVKSVKVSPPHGGQFSASFQKIFSEIFEDETQNLAPGIQLDLTLSLFEAAMGCTKDLTFGAFIPCNICYGKGHPSETNKKDCPTCKGVGKVTIPPFTSKCHFCKGMGYIMKDSCITCRGKGIMDGIKKLKVKIPRGVENGDTIFISEAGNVGPHWSRPGNLFIQLKISENNVFTRHGTDLHVDTNITLTQAVLGGRVQVPGLSGQISLKIPVGVQHGHVVILRGRGLPHSGCLLDHGDMYVRFRINLPRSLNEEQRAIFEEFAREEIFQENYGSMVLL